MSDNFSYPNLLVDQSKKVTFNFEGESFTGYAGDNVATALWRNNQKIISRSFKYHRPRGIFSLTGHDANTLVQLPEEGNVPADLLPITDGLTVKGQHYSGSLKNDYFSIFGKFSKFLPVGFYYKAFYKNNSWDKIWGGFFRKFTGLGIINPKNEGGYYDKKYLFYDVVIIGSGLAGLQSALESAKSSKAQVLIIEQESCLGGSLNFSRLDVEGKKAQEYRDKLVAEVEKTDNITIMLNSICNAAYSDNWLSVIQDKRAFKLRAKQLILCPGNYEQALVFHNNDLPGVMLSTAAQRLLKLYGVKPGEKAVIATAHDDGYLVALDLHEAGVAVQRIVDLRQNVSDNSYLEAVKKLGIEVSQKSTIYAANSANKVLASVQMGKISTTGECASDTETIDCDLLCLSGGYMPAYQLACQIGAALDFSEEDNKFIVKKLPKNCYTVGTGDGVELPSLIENKAKIVAHQALSELGLAEGTAPKPSTEKEKINEFAYPIFAHPKSKEFVDFDEDLQVADIINAVREGYTDIQLVKRFSTLGMGPSQGRFCAFMSSILVSNYDKSRTIGDVGVTTARPPYAAEKIGHHAGRSFFPERHSNMHHCHTDAGAQFLIAGPWMRPAYYGAKGSMLECVAKESLNVHNNVGVVDVSTLGGLEIRGPDAAEFINRMYTWNFLKQPVGRARYALLTNESGVVIDDGVACRFSEQNYYVTATTGGVDRVYLQFLKWNAQWRLKVDIANVTSAWCGVNIAGPNSRKVLQKICQDVDLSVEGFPYMGVREGTVAGIPARLIRVGFVGELGYEVHVPQHYGEYLWESIMEAGKEFNIAPFGIEAQRLLRLQKGHIIISQDTDATTYPEEVHMSWAVGKKKPFFVGQKAIQIVDEKKPVRKLIGFEVSSSQTVPKESHLCFNGDQLIGRITSCAASAKLQKTIGLAYVDPDFSEPGATLQIRCDNKEMVLAKVVNLPFYDPENARQEL
jgi:sarcosine oxidase subunit alpha